MLKIFYYNILPFYYLYGRHGMIYLLTKGDRTDAFLVRKFISQKKTH